MKIQKKTKIVATLGPAIDSIEMLEEMMMAGVNVFRINFSHAEYDDAAQKIKDIRYLNEKHNFHVAVLADLQGPKLRVGVMGKKVKLKKGDVFTFTTDKCEGDEEKAYMTYKNFPKDVEAGEQILVDDGKLLFEFLGVNAFEFYLDLSKLNNGIYFAKVTTANASTEHKLILQK